MVLTNKVMEVVVEQGRLKGLAGLDRLGRTFLSFKGVPYAKPPVRELRFKDPIEPSSWGGTRNATQDGAACFTYPAPLGQSSDDCLYLNIFCPKVSKELKPVLVYIHGGGFKSHSNDSSILGGEFLVAEDVVVVTVNYRLLLLGFLHFDDPSLGVGGNAGIKDVLMALKWIKKNIEAFEGDPNNITISGTSAGGIIVQWMMLSKQAKGLFHKAIAISGFSMELFCGKTNNARILAKHLKVDHLDDHSLLKHLQNLPLEKLYNNFGSFHDCLQIGRERIFGPLLLPNPNDGLLHSSPKDIIESKTFNQVPLLFGYTLNEGIFGANVTNSDGILLEPQSFIPLDILKGLDQTSVDQIFQKIVKTYFGGVIPSKSSLEPFKPLYHDIIFYFIIYREAIRIARATSNPVYFFRLGFDSMLNLSKFFFDNTASGATHGDDVHYLFKCSKIPAFPDESREMKLVDKFVKIITGFMRSGKLECPEFLPQFTYLDIQDEVEVKVNLEEEAIQFWSMIIGEQ